MAYRGDMRNPYNKIRKEEEVAPKGTQMGNTQAKTLFRRWQSGETLTPAQQDALIKAGLALQGDFK